ncbi:MAG: AAA family ATPase [Candidatus Poribacteria bacterium]
MDNGAICFSRSMSSGGEEIASIVAEKMSYRYVDDNIITIAAEKGGVTPETIGKVERSSEMINRILGYMSHDTGRSNHFTSIRMGQSEEYRQLIQSVVVETAKTGSIVIVAHGAAIPLAEMPGVLRVFVTASQSKRTERHMAESNLGEQRAKEAIVASDSQRADFLRNFYDINQELPTHYDIVLNTDKLTPSIAANVVVSAAREM